MLPNMTLEVWPSDFGLPSVDYRCLQFMLCARISAAPVTILKATNCWRSASGNFPVLRRGADSHVTEFYEFTKHLRALKDVSLDNDLDESEKGIAAAYEALLTDKLLPAYLYLLWVDNANFNVVTNRWFGKTLYFPYGLYYVSRSRSKAKQYLHTMFPGELVTLEQIELAVTKEAISCINILSAKLGDKKYFFGDKPSTLDALVVGYLAPLLKLPLPNDRIHSHIKSCQNLVRLVESTLRIYLPLTDEELTHQQSTMHEWERLKMKAQSEIHMKKKSEASAGEEEEVFKLRDTILFAVGAVVFTVLFAVHFGIVQIEVKDVSKEDNSQTVVEID